MSLSALKHRQPLLVAQDSLKSFALYFIDDNQYEEQQLVLAFIYQNIKEKELQLNILNTAL